ncbi:ABC-type multidrug transport system, ATPase and permease component [Paraoerskovia marina]|uniref:ABC-type multidrug transport system, ATPase and permease component n=1 Tax=Paraoerskovia marina TaxID=545619 RepID=A0A1H1T829_9CELL|nr:ABC transporter ATP-binding protein [Paraoerskovia marina]SDS56372.1 ABC-type multidrug transport system, ATPase and permease component [Paraoerskovia marina]
MSYSRIETTSSLGVLATVRQGLRTSPEMVTGIGVTLVLAVVAAAGRVVVPMTVQQTVDTGIMADGGPDVARVSTLVAVAAVVLVVAGVCTALVNVRLFRSSEEGLANLRIRTFRHVHDLPVLTQGTERRGSLVSRVTSDVDTISQFVQRGGIQLLVSVLQIAVATVLMAIYSWQLTVLVWLCFVPLVMILNPAQKRVSAAFGLVRQRTGELLGAVSEAVVGAQTVRAYGVQARTGRRVEAAVERARVAMVRASRLVGLVFSSGVLVANLVLAVVVVAGTWLGVAGEVTTGELLAFLFLVQLFTGPVQQATEILNELQNAVSGWRRVLAVLETPIDVRDEGTVDSPSGPASVELDDVRFSYPGGPEVLHGVTVAFPAARSVAVVGKTGSGKSTIAKLVTRLMDPTAGVIRLDGTDLRDIPVARLRERVVLVPQEGFLFSGTLLENIEWGVRDDAVRADRDAVVAVAQDAVSMLGLDDWVDGLADGLATQVGQRGEHLSAGERQLVALLRAAVAEADLLVLDEATSAVDPAAEVRIARALSALTTGRTTVTIAHRLSTAEAADLVVVVDEGDVVEVGTHAALLERDGTYAAMHGAWRSQTH